MTMYLYRNWGRGVTLAVALGALCAGGRAQIFRAPQPERTTPRAVAVLETYANGTRRLVPVSFFYERHYYDADFYHATPVPMALYAETLYEVEQYGKPLGTFTVLGATREREVWFGNGRYRSLPPEAELAKKKAAMVKVDDPTRPVLHRRPGSEGDRPAVPAGTTSAAQTGEDDAARPTLHRRANQDGAADASTSRPRLHRSEEAGNGELMADADPDRPILRRGKPEGGAGEAEGAAVVSGAAAAAAEPVMRQVAVSDAGRSDAQQVLFACTAAQRSQMETAARALAISELRRLAAARGLLAAGGDFPAEPALANEQFVPYDLDYNNYATVVFSALYRPPDAEAGGKSWVVTVIARQSDDRLVKLYSAVSDPRDLDDYPELRLVDAVDPDGYGRYALLFHERKQDGASWLLGRMDGYELETLFETPER